MMLCVTDLRANRRPRHSVNTTAIVGKRSRLLAAVAAEIRQAVIESGLTTMKIAENMGLASDIAVIRLTRAEGHNATLGTLSDIAHALGKRVVVKLEDE